MANPNPSPETRFRPGCPPGPGRPRTKPLTDRIREKLEDPAVVEEIAEAWLDSVKARDVSALRTLLERLEGKVPDQVRHDGELTVRVEYADGDDHASEAAPGTGEDPP